MALARDRLGQGLGYGALKLGKFLGKAFRQIFIICLRNFGGELGRLSGEIGRGRP